MRLYHGSAEQVPKPSIKKCRPHNDYGPGFYCTLDKDLACEWACNVPNRDGYCNEYEIDEGKLAIADLDEHPDGVLAWLAVLMANRVFDSGWAVETRKSNFIERYNVDLSGADIVCGYRADDSYFSIARGFLAGTFTDVQVEKALRFGELGRQAVIVSPKAFRALAFQQATWVSGEQWHPRWLSRDTMARAAFRELALAKGKRQGNLITDLVEE